MLSSGLELMPRASGEVIKLIATLASQVQELEEGFAKISCFVPRGKSELILSSNGGFLLLDLLLPIYYSTLVKVSTQDCSRVLKRAQKLKIRSARSASRVRIAHANGVNIVNRIKLEIVAGIPAGCQGLLVS